MPVPSTMSDLNTAAASNSPAGSESPNVIDDYHRALSAIVRRTNSRGADITAGATTDLALTTDEVIGVTGTGVSISSFGTMAAGIKRTLIFGASNTIVHNGTSLICPNAVDLITTGNDVVELRSLGAGNWIVTDVNRPRLKSAAVSFTRDTALASGTQAITGVGFRPSTAIFIMAKDAQDEMSIGFAGTDRGSQVILSRTTNFVSSSNIAIFAEQTTADYVFGTVASWDADGCTISWTRAGAPTGTITVKALFFV